jgi:hypothetical protein
MACVVGGSNPSSLAIKIDLLHLESEMGGLK